MTKPETQPDYPISPEAIEEAEAVYLVRKVMTANFPDINVMLNGTILLSSHGPMSVCLGTILPNTFDMIGFEA